MPRFFSSLSRFLTLEKTFLAFVFLRPIIDLGRDTSIINLAGNSITFTTLFALGFLLWGGYCLWKYRQSLSEIPGKYILLSVLVLPLLSIFWSVSPTTTALEWSKLVLNFLFFAVAFVLIKNKKITFKELMYTLIASAIIPVIFGMIQLAQHSGIDTFGVDNRIYGSFAHPNVFAFFLLFLFFAAVHYCSLFIKSNIYSKWLEITGSILIFLLIAFTYTRAAWVGILLFFFLLCVFYNRKLLLIGALGIALFYITISPISSLSEKYFHYNIQDNSLVSRLTTRNKQADSLSWRSEVVKNSVPIIFQNPILGYGYGTFPEVWEAMRPPERQQDDSSEAHNDYLRILVEVGSVGLILYFLFLFQLVLATWQSVKQHKANFPNVVMFCWIIVFAVVSLSDNMLHHTPVMVLMWTYWGAFFASQKKVRAPNFLK